MNSLRKTPRLPKSQTVRNQILQNVPRFLIRYESGIVLVYDIITQKSLVLEIELFRPYHIITAVNFTGKQFQEEFNDIIMYNGKFFCYFEEMTQVFLHQYLLGKRIKLEKKTFDLSVNSALLEQIKKYFNIVGNNW